MDDIDVNVQSAAGSVGSTVDLDIYERTGTSAGFETSPSGWTLVATGSGTSAAEGSPTLITLSSDFTLAPGVDGIAIENIDFHQEYANGSNTYSNADLTLTLGSASNTALPLRLRAEA